MTSAWGGGGGTQKADESADKLRQCDSDKGEGGQMSFVICHMSFLYFNL